MKPLAPIRKMVAAALGLIGQLVALNVLHGNALQLATGVLAAGVLLGVYAAPNTNPAPSALFIPGQVVHQDPYPDGAVPAPLLTPPPAPPRARKRV